MIWIYFVNSFIIVCSVGNFFLLRTKYGFVFKWFFGSNNNFASLFLTQQIFCVGEYLPFKFTDCFMIKKLPLAISNHFSQAGFIWSLYPGCFQHGWLRFRSIILCHDSLCLQRKTNQFQRFADIFLPFSNVTDFF